MDPIDQHPPVAAAAANNQPKTRPEDEDNYDSSSDEDFNPESANADENVSESEVEDAAGDESASRSTSDKKRRKGTQHDEEDGNLSNSGDEAIIRKGKKRRKGRNGNNAGDDDEGGEGGLIKTRAQRAREGKEKKALADTSSATVDVDALWATMNMNMNSLAAQATAEPSSDPSQTVPNEGSTSKDESSMKEQPASTANSHRKEAGEEEMITIKRSYDFAGETISEEKRVPKSSAEARLYFQSLQSQQRPNPSTLSSSKPALRRPKKRTSMFDPGPSVTNTAATSVGLNKGTGTRTGTGAESGSVIGGKSGPNKLNTIEKSKLDWAGFVDKEGINDELDEHSRAKEGYLGRMDFLNQVREKTEEEERRGKKL